MKPPNWYLRAGSYMFFFRKSFSKPFSFKVSRMDFVFLRGTLERLGVSTGPSLLPAAPLTAQPQSLPLHL